MPKSKPETTENPEAAESQKKSLPGASRATKSVNNNLLKLKTSTPASAAVAKRPSIQKYPLRSNSVTTKKGTAPAPVPRISAADTAIFRTLKILDDPKAAASVTSRILLPTNSGTKKSSKVQSKTSVIRSQSQPVVKVIQEAPDGEAERNPSPPPPSKDESPPVVATSTPKPKQGQSQTVPTSKPPKSTPAAPKVVRTGPQSVIYGRGVHFTRSPPTPPTADDQEEPLTRSARGAKTMALAKAKYLESVAAARTGPSSRFGLGVGPRFGPGPAKKVTKAQKSKTKLTKAARHPEAKQVDKYYVPTPYKFHASFSSTDALIPSAPSEKVPVTVEFKNPNSLSALESEFGGSANTLGSSSISILKAQDAREEARAKKAVNAKVGQERPKNSSAKSKTTVKFPGLAPPKPLVVPSKPPPKQLTPFCTSCKKNPTIHASGPIAMSEFTATLERMRTKIQDVKLREATVAELDAKVHARALELKDLESELEEPPKNSGEGALAKKEALQAQIEATEAALQKFAALESGVRLRVEERLHLQPIAVLEELRSSEQLQQQPYLEETLVLFFQLLKLCEGSMHEDWFDDVFVKKVWELDTELGKRLGLHVEGQLEFEKEQPRACHSSMAPGEAGTLIQRSSSK